MSMHISDNFLDPKNALRKHTNAVVWALLASGKKLVYKNYWDDSKVVGEDDITINSYELPLVWDLMAGNPALLNSVDGTIVRTQKCNEILAEMVKTYDGKYKILHATYCDKKKASNRFPKIYRQDDDFDTSTYKYPCILVAVEEKIRNKKCVRVYSLEIDARLHQHASNKGFPRYVAIARETAIKEINTHLTDFDRASMAELMLHTPDPDDYRSETYYPRDYIIMPEVITKSCETCGAVKKVNGCTSINAKDCTGWEAEK